MRINSFSIHNCLVVVLLSGTTCAFSLDLTHVIVPSILTPVAVASAVWAVTEKNKKDASQQNVVRLEAECTEGENKLHAVEKERDEYKSGVVQTKEDQKIIAKACQFVSQEISLDSCNGRIYQSVFTGSADSVDLNEDLFISGITQYIAEQNSTAELVEKEKRSKLVSAYKYQKKLECILTRVEQSGQLHIKAQEVAAQLEKLTLLLEEETKVLIYHKKFFDLVCCFEKRKKGYAREYSFFKSGADHQFQETIFAYIRMYYSSMDIYFPYLAYYGKIVTDANTLRQAYQECMNGRHHSEANQEVFAEVQGYLHMFDEILAIIVSSSFYEQEIAQKPEHDRQQERLTMEMKERDERLRAELKEREMRMQKEQERMAQEKRLAKIRLQDEKNKQLALENQAVELEKKRLELQVSQQEMALEMARIREGENIDTAVMARDEKWQVQVDNLEKEVAQLREKCEVLLAQAEKDKEHFERTVSTQMQRHADELNLSLSNERDEWQQRVSDLEKLCYTLDQKVTHAQAFCSVALKHVQDAATFIQHVPVNTSAIDGLDEYVGRIDQYVGELQDHVATLAERLR